MAESWFAYDDSGDVCSPLNYARITIPNCPEPNQRLCAIFATIQTIGGIQRPVITPALCTQIQLALSTLTESANVLLKPN